MAGNERLMDMKHVKRRTMVDVIVVEDLFGVAILSREKVSSPDLTGARLKSTRSSHVAWLVHEVGGFIYAKEPVSSASEP